MKIKKVLIANRGEIALRVMRTCRELGIKTVAVYSTADRRLPFVQFADEAYCIGEGPSKESYLLADKIIATAQSAGADAIHPGYGFLSENASFSAAVERAGLIFIGPSAHSIEVMGSKISAKQAAARFEVPMVPGTDQAIQNLEEAKQIAEKTGYPLLIKASAGGGGKGMRVVQKAEDLESQMQAAKSEAMSSFNDDKVFIEKYVANPKHIEIQILGDKHGNYIHLFERECSIQRRHQKLIEEAPSSCLTPEIRERMGQAAIDVARACDYSGAGTVEFLVDDALDFYFLEMNTRLQVEHCVTEEITGIDLVKMQIIAAQGDKLPLRQSDLSIQGHAIELRVCAEDPLNDFLPDNGTLQEYIPSRGPGVRVDDGFEQGLDIPIYYDSMIAKLICHASDRDTAIQRLIRAIDEYRILGIKNTLAFGKWAVNVPAFREGNFDTHFIQKYYKPELLQSTDHQEAAAIIASILYESSSTTASKSEVMPEPSSSNWRRNRS